MQINTQYIPLYLIDPNPYQPRTKFDEAQIHELARSINSDGLMQFPSAREVDGRYQLVFGHRRFEAFKVLSKLFDDDYDTMPVNVVERTDEQMAIQAYEENEKRADLNPVERAKAVRNMLNVFGWNQQDVAEKLHIDRSTVSNMIRMLRMPDEVLNAIAQGVLPVRSAMSLMAYYELTELEMSAVHSKWDGELDDFVALARAGEVNSDVIREKLEYYLEFLHPQPVEPLKLDLQPVVENVIDKPAPAEVQPTISEDWVPASEAGGVEMEPEIISAEEDDLEEEVESESLDEEEETIDENPVQPQKQPQPTVEGAAVSEPVISSDEILFTITWKPGMVLVGLRKPGQTIPKFKAFDTLSPEEVPAVMREMGL